MAHGGYLRRDEQNVTFLYNSAPASAEEVLIAALQTRVKDPNKTRIMIRFSKNTRKQTLYSSRILLKLNFSFNTFYKRFFSRNFLLLHFKHKIFLKKL